MNNSAQNNNNQPVDQTLGNTTDTNSQPTPSVPLNDQNTQPPMFITDEHIQNVGTAKPSENVNTFAPVENNILSSTNSGSNPPTPPSPAEKHKTKKLTLALLGFAGLAILVGAGMLAVNLLQKPKDTTTPSAATEERGTGGFGWDGNCFNFTSANIGCVAVLYHCPNMTSFNNGDSSCDPINGGPGAVQLDYLRVSENGQRFCLRENMCGMQQLDIDCDSSSAPLYEAFQSRLTTSCEVDEATPPGVTPTPTAIPGCTDNYCNPGGPWEDKCGDVIDYSKGWEHTWDEGFYAACFPATPTPPGVTPTPTPTPSPSPTPAVGDLICTSKNAYKPAGDGSFSNDQPLTSVSKGETFYYQFGFRNGTSTVNEAKLTDVLSDELEFVSFTQTGNTYTESTHTASRTFSSLAPGVNGAMVIKVKVKDNASGTITNTATVTYEGDTQPSNCSVTLSLKTSSPTPTPTPTAPGATPTPTSSSTPTSQPELPDAGVSTPTLIGGVAGVLLLLGAMLLAL